MRMYDFICIVDNSLIRTDDKCYVNKLIEKDVIFMKKIVALVLCVIVVMGLGGCSGNYETKSRDDFHNDYVVDIKDTLPCKQLCNTKKFLKGDECYVYEFTEVEVKTFLDRIDTSWHKLPFDNSEMEKIYKTKDEDGKTLADIGGFPLVTRGYWAAKTDKGVTNQFELDGDFSLAILDTVNCKLYYFKRKA